MNARLQSDLDGLETALSGLTESITSYNPSVQAAQGVLAADAALGASIEELVVHQRNHAALAALQREAAQLEGQLRAALGDLAAARTQIQAAGTRARPPLASYRKVDAKALLDHAHHAAPYAAPVGFVPPPKEGGAAAAEAAAAAGTAGDGGAAPDPGAIEPAPSQSQPDTASAAGAATTAAGGAERNNPALAALEPGLRAWLDPITQLPFTPWPSNDMVARSGMARVQGWSGAVDMNAMAAALEEQAAAARPPVAVEEGQGESQEQDEEQRRKEEARARAHQTQQQQQQQKAEKQVFRGMELVESDEE